MRPAVRDLLGESDLPASSVVGQARAWVSSFDHDRAVIAATAAPVGLGPCRALLLQALDSYEVAARSFERAALLPMADRPPCRHHGGRRRGATR
jgi:hypothetical protein